MKRLYALLLAAVLLLTPALGLCDSGSYWRGYDRGYGIGSSEGAADKVEDLKYRPYSYKYFKDIYEDKNYSYQRGFKDGYKRGYKDAYGGDIIIEERIVEERIIVE